MSCCGGKRSSLRATLGPAAGGHPRVRTVPQPQAPAHPEGLSGTKPESDVLANPFDRRAALLRLIGRHANRR